MNSPNRLAYEVGNLHGETRILKKALGLRELGEMFVGKRHKVSRETESSVALRRAGYHVTTKSGASRRRYLSAALAPKKDSRYILLVSITWRPRLK